MSKRLLLFLLSLLLPLSATAETVRLDFVLPFRNLTPFPHQFRSDLDCEQLAGFNVGHAAYLKRDLTELLTQHEIAIVDTEAQFGLRLYVTHEECGISGEENYRSFPLGLGVSEKDYSSAYLRVLAELQDKQTGQLISMREYVSVARLERNFTRILFFHLAAEEKRVNKRDLWQSIATELTKGIAEDVKR